jgi:hypothetical protein
MKITNQVKKSETQVVTAEFTLRDIITALNADHQMFRDFKNAFALVPLNQLRVQPCAELSSIISLVCGPEKVDPDKPLLRIMHTVTTYKESE